MPTGMGKTDTMVALFAAVAPERLLILVPSDALRSQIAKTFERYGSRVVSEEADRQAGAGPWRSGLHVESYACRS